MKEGSVYPPPSQGDHVAAEEAATIPYARDDRELCHAPLPCDDHINGLALVLLKQGCDLLECLDGGGAASLDGAKPADAVAGSDARLACRGPLRHLVDKRERWGSGVLCVRLGASSSCAEFR